MPTNLPITAHSHNHDTALSFQFMFYLFHFIISNIWIVLARLMFYDCFTLRAERCDRNTLVSNIPSPLHHAGSMKSDYTCELENGTAQGRF